jgi:hypothetical protein
MGDECGGAGWSPDLSEVEKIFRTSAMSHDLWLYYGFCSSSLVDNLHNTIPSFPYADTPI